MKSKLPFSFKKRALSFGFAWQGLWLAIKTQHNLWIHMGAALCVVVLAFVFQVTSTEWMMLLLVIGLVIAAELLNTAIEFVVDLVSPEFHPLAKAAKDVAAAAVLVVAILSIGIGLLVFIPYLSILL